MSLLSFLNPWLSCFSSRPLFYSSLDSTFDIDSNTYLQLVVEYYKGYLGPRSNVQWLLSSYPFLSSSYFPTWNHLVGLFTWKIFIVLSYCPRLDIFLAQRHHQWSSV